MRFLVLGPIQATAGDGVVDVSGAKERTLLARLVLGINTTVSATDLVDSLWGEDPPRTAAKSLQTYVLRLRNTLEPGRTSFSSVLATEGAGYRLVAPAESVDAERFARLTTQGRSALAADRPVEAAATLREALALWRGPAYAGIDAPVVQAAARRLEELRVSAVEDRLAAELAFGQSAAVAAELEQLVVEHPYRERFWSLLVLALYRGGRQGDALAAYNRCRTVLVDDVGVEPGHELRALHARVLDQDPTLSAHRRRAVLLPTALAPSVGPLVGRDAELAMLRTAWQGSAVEPRAIVLRGPTGAGATRLAAQLAAEVAASGVPVTLDAAGATGGLVVYDKPGAMPDPAQEIGLVLVLAGPDLQVPAGYDVVDLDPLSASAVRDLVSSYVDATELEAAAAYVLRESGGWPGAVHAEALAWARRSAADVVAAAATRTGVSSADLLTARGELSDGVVALQHADALSADLSLGRCPWPGLAAYDVADASRFAGRERLVAELVARLASVSVLALVGSSGSGKSSVVRAGLLAALGAGALPGSASWRQLVMRPGPHPMRELARVALRADRHTEAPDDLGALLEHALRVGAADERVVLVVDQLEELWTVCDDAGERAAFLDTIADFSGASQVLPVLVLRSDFVGELADHARLASLVSDGTVLVGTPREAEVRRAVALPAQRCGLVLETGLLDAVVDDAGREPGALPLLSTALARLWERREGRTLTLRAYVADGGLSGAIARLAEREFLSLSSAEQATARVVLLRLAGPGDGEGVARRRTLLAELVELEVPLVARVVEHLAAARLITVSDGRAEVAHEALFREWPRLRGWLADDVAGRDVLRRLARDAAEWDAHQRDETLLWRGTRLLAGAEIAQAHGDEITALERDFLDHGHSQLDSEQKAAEDRAAAAAAQNSRLRRLLGGLVLVLVLALVAGGLALRSRDQADTARAAAEAKRLAASAVTEDYLDLALLSAVEAVRSERSPETYGALLTLLGRLPDVLTQVRTRNRFLGGAASPDHRTVYLWENEAVLRAIVATTGHPRWTVDLPGQALWVSGSPDGRLLAVPCVTDTGPEVLLLDAGTGKEVQRVEGSGTDGDTSGDSRSVPVPGLLPQAVWLSDSRLAVLASSGLLVLDRGTWSPDEPISWQPDDVSESAVLRALGPERVVVSGSGRPIVVIDAVRRRTRALKVDGDVQAASPDGSVVALTTWPSGAEGSRGASLTLLDGTSFKPVAPLIPLPGFHGGIAFSADGTQVAVGAGDLVQVRNSHTGELVRELSGHSGTVMGATFTRPDKNLLWSIGRDGTAFQWDLTRSRGVIRSAPSEVATHLGATSEDGRVGVAMTFNEDKPNEVFPLDPGSGRRLGDGPLPIPDGCPCQPWSVAITPDGATALGGIEELSKPDDWEGPRTGRLVLWDVAHGNIRSQVALPWPVIGLGVVPDGSRAVVNGTGGWAVIDLTQPRIRASVKDSPTDMLELPDTVALSPDGRTAALGRGRDVVLVNTRTGAEFRRRSLPEGDGMLTGTWPDDRTLVVGGWRGVLRVLRSSDLADIAPARLVAPGWITDLITSPDGQLVASTDTDGQIMLLDTASWRPLGKPVVKRGGWGWLSFSPDGHTLQAYFDRSDRAEMSMNPNDWLRSACRLAARELSPDEWAAVHPDQPWRATCGRDGEAAVAATR